MHYTIHRFVQTLHKLRYKEYLKSDEWKLKKESRLKKDNYICQVCLITKATLVHHITYEHVFKEFSFELTSVCAYCHACIHSIGGLTLLSEKEKEERIDKEIVEMENQALADYVDMREWSVGDLICYVETRNNEETAKGATTC